MAPDLAREGLAKGVKGHFYDGLEGVTLDWYGQEKNRVIRGHLAEHFSRFADECAPYETMAMRINEEEPRLRGQAVQASSSAIAPAAQPARTDHPRHPPQDRRTARTRGRLRSAARARRADQIAAAARMEALFLPCPRGRMHRQGKGQRALHLKREIGARATLFGEKSRREEGRDLLAAVYAAFSEGFEKSDLQAAKTLLAELS